MSSFNSNDIRRLAILIADHVEQMEEKLNSADGKLGDGDLGITVARGWREIANNVDLFPNDVGRTLLECSKCFQRASSSSFGTLVATVFMSAAKTCKGSESMPYSTISQLLNDGCEAMITRGKGQLGDKSVLDIVHAMATASKGLDAPDQIANAVRKAAENTLDEYREQPNKLGRARMFGKKSIGLDDPGMLAVMEMLKALD
jgi:dihydroxyacetone kinase-like protein